VKRRDFLFGSAAAAASLAAPEHFQLVDHAPELDIRNGLMPIPNRPGLGVELVDDRVRPFLWATCKR
jgi:L-alanine-DL-glutamate epimerase-like enolase superfamily enzyme